MPIFIFTAILMLLPVFGNPASAQSCLLCSDEMKSSDQIEKQEKPLRIEIATKLSFSKIALAGGAKSATVAIDPHGDRSIDDNIVDLGGYPEAGTVTLTGEPGKYVRIDLPRQVTMRSSTGGIILIKDMKSTLGPAPQLDQNGRLSFSFGGKLDISGNLSGRFRGRISITAEYE